jgi:hypothetical protein
VFFGRDDGWAESGMNRKGLAFCWVDSLYEPWEPGPEMREIPGSPSEWMLKTCGTVAEAIKFFKTRKESGFSSGKIFVADRTGASALIGAKNKRLVIDKSTLQRSVGVSATLANKKIRANTRGSAANGADILRACRQEGQMATQYGALFQLQSGDITLLLLPNLVASSTINLTQELSKGPHYYDLAQIEDQLGQPPLPLVDNMKRRYLSELKPLADQQPEITRRVQAVLEAAQTGELNAEDFTIDIWKKIDPLNKETQAQMRKLGSLLSLTLMDRWDEPDRRVFRYRAEHKRATVLYGITLDDENRISTLLSEEIIVKPIEPSLPPVKTIKKQPRFGGKVLYPYE